MYVRNGYAKISGLHSCKLMMETLVNSLKKENISYNPIDLRMAEEDEIKKNLESREFLSDYSGKSIQSFIHSFVCYSFSPYRFRLTTL